MTESEKNQSINVVFEYTKESYKGGRFISSYPDQEAIKEVKRECEEPDSNTKIHAIGVSDAEAQRMCMEAMILSDVFETRMQAIEDDPEMPEMIKGLEKMKLEFAAGASVTGLLFGIKS
ncbi:MAG: hypothetical protein WC517_02085 [Patescibacteria group bacterium]